MDKSVKPVLQALLVADRVYQDHPSGKRIVAGIFDKLSFRKKVPSEVVGEQGEQGEQERILVGGGDPGSPYAYISMTSLRGNKRFVVRYVYLNEDKVLFQTEFGIVCENPLETAQIVFPLPKLPIVGAGAYALELLCEDEPIGVFRITAEELQGEPSDDSE